MTENIANLIGAVFDVFRAELQEASDWGGLRASQLRFLTRVPDDGVRLGEMAGRAAMSKAGAGQFAAILEKRGYIALSADPDDSRAKVIRRTAVGRRLAEQVLATVTEIEREWSASIGPGRYAAMRAALEEIVARNHAPSAAPSRPQDATEKTGDHHTANVQTIARNRAHHGEREED